MVNLDPTISYGHIIEMAIFIIGAIGVIYTLKTDVGALKGDVRELQTETKKITDILILLSRQDERLKSLETRINLK